MADEGKLETPPPGDYRKRFWKRYRKTVFDWTVKTFWLRVFVLFAVPATLTFQYKPGHTDWYTIWVTMAIYAAIKPRGLVKSDVDASPKKCTP
jgi:hypothetical protein